MAQQLYRIGNNLNQIAQKAHTLNVIDVQRYDAAVSQFETAVKEISEAVNMSTPHQAVTNGCHVHLAGQRLAGKSGGLC